MDKLTIALVQADLIWEQAEANRAQFDRYFAALPAEVQLVVLPEMFTTGFSMTPQSLAEPMEGTTHQWMRQWAAQLDAAIVGSIIIEEKKAYYNRLLWVMPSGETLYYDKRHLFTLAGEQHQYTAGEQLLAVDYRGWRIRPLICYDLRFPVWSRNTNAYDLLLYIANFPDKRGHAWRSLLLARAIENQAYVIGLNRVGTDVNGLYYAGDSCLIDYTGQPKLHLPAKATVGLITIERDPLLVYRNKLAFLADRDHFNIH